MLILRRQRPRVFCIGFNKTGTTTLHRHFRSLGLRSEHNTAWPHYSHISVGARYFTRADCFSDGEMADFRRLQAWFPNSVFVLNDRNERAWLRSRIKHVLRHGAPASLSEALTDPKLQHMAETFYADPRQAIDMWIAQRRIYHRTVLAHFGSASSFLHLFVTEDPDWNKRLDHAMQEAGAIGPARAGVSPDAANTRSEEEVPEQDKLAHYLDLLEDRLAKAGSEE